MAQAKRIKVNESNDGVAGFTAATLIVPSEPREEINFHNIWASVTVELQDAAANAQGTWVLMIVKVGGSIPAFTDALTNSEANNFFIIACGVWSASNETPYNSGAIHPETSRTLNAGDQLIIVNTVTGITAGLASNRVMICAHTTRK